MISNKRKIAWILAIIICGLGLAMIIETRFRNWVVNGLQDTFLGPTVNAWAGFAASVVANPFWIQYIQPYLFWWSGVFWITVSVIVVKVLWPRRPKALGKAAPAVRELQNKLTPSPPAPIASATSAPAPVTEKKETVVEEKAEAE